MTKIKAVAIPTEAIQIPTYPPDPDNFGRYQPSDKMTAVIDYALWHSTQDTPGVLFARRWAGTEPTANTRATGTYRRIKYAHEIGEMGLRPLMDALGFQVEVRHSTHEPSADHPSFTDYLMRVPSPSVIHENAGEISYPPEFEGRMRIGLSQKEQYSTADQFAGVQGRYAILSTSEKGNLTLHDILDHLLAELGFSGEQNAMLAQTVTSLEESPEVFRRFRLRRQQGLQKDFMVVYEELRKVSSYTAFLNGDKDTIRKWSLLLEIDFQDMAGIAERANLELRNLKIQKRVGGVSLAA